MATYLVIKNGNATKSYTCKDSEPNKPYLKVSNKYLPLTTNTTTGLKVKANGNEYSPLASYTTTTERVYYSGTESNSNVTILDGHTCYYAGYTRGTLATGTAYRYYSETNSWYETINMPNITYDGQEITSCSVSEEVTNYNNTFDAQITRSTSISYTASASRTSAHISKIQKTAENTYTAEMNHQEKQIYKMIRSTRTARANNKVASSYSWYGTQTTTSRKATSRFENETVTLAFSTSHARQSESKASITSKVTTEYTLKYSFSQTKLISSSVSDATYSAPYKTVTETITVE
jgi:hypothetical protein